MIQKTGNVILLAEISILVMVLVAGHGNHPQAQQCDCEKVFNLLDTINGKLDKILTPEPVCKPIDGFKSINVHEPKTVLNDISGPHGLETKGNDLYIAGLRDGYVYSHYNTQQGGSKPMKLIKSSKTAGGRQLASTFMDLHDDILYVTEYYAKAIYQIPLNGGAKKLISLGNVQPVGIKFSPDGKTVIIGDLKGLLRVYDTTMTKLIYTINAKADCGSNLREISFLSDDKFFLSNFGSSFCIYQKDHKLERFTHVKPNKETSSPNIDGYYVHCDGTIIATDRSGGRLIQMDKNFKTISTLGGFQPGLIDVAVTDDGTLAVSNSGKNTVKLYSL